MPPANMTLLSGMTTAEAATMAVGRLVPEFQVTVFPDIAPKYVELRNVPLAFPPPTISTCPVDSKTIVWLYIAVGKFVPAAHDMVLLPDVIDPK